MNTIANRTLISDETNLKIRDKAPAVYLHDPEIFPSGATPALMEPHFLDAHVLVHLDDATEALSDEEAAELYERFIRDREQAIITEIRRVCGIAAAPAATLALEPVEIDELAPDVLDADEEPDEEPDEQLLEPALD